MTELSELIENIHEVSAPNMFGVPEEKLFAACKRLLVHKGYRVVEPLDLEFEIKEIKDLVTKFYGLLHNKYPERSRDYINVKKDAKLAINFYKSRKDTGLNKEAALNECGVIIQILFKHEKEFNLKYPIRDFGIFGQGNVGWITDKALQIMNTIMQGKYEDALEEQMENNLALADPSEMDFGLSEETLKQLEEKDA